MLIKDLQPFQQWSNIKSIIDSRAKTSENFHEFLRSLAKSLKITFLHPMRRSMKMLSFKKRNLSGLKNISSTTRPEMLYKKDVLSNFEKFI